eukprot:8635376-Alexandrium_andersonii.AAC.1
MAPLEVLEDLKVALTYGDASAADLYHAVALLQIALGSSLRAPLPQAPRHWLGHSWTRGTRLRRMAK